VAGTGGGAAGRGGTTGSGGSTGTGGSTAAPNWVPSFSVVYQLDGAIGQLAVEAHGILQLNEIGTFFPIPDPMGIAIEGSSAQFRLMAQDPGRLVQPAGTALPSQLQTPDGTSFTMGGWFRINSTQSGNIQYLISNDGPGDYMGGFVFYLDQTNGSFGNNAAKTYCRIGTSGSTTDFNYNEAESPSEIGRGSRSRHQADSIGPRSVHARLRPGLLRFRGQHGRGVLHAHRARRTAHQSYLRVRHRRLALPVQRHGLRHVRLCGTVGLHQHPLLRYAAVIPL
jgi:hypothetical protein